MPSITERPLSKQELERLISEDEFLALKHPNHNQRREYEIRTMALKYVLEHIKWVSPAEATIQELNELASK